VNNDAYEITQEQMIEAIAEGLSSMEEENAAGFVARKGVANNGN